MDTPDLGKRRLLDDSAAHSILRLQSHKALSGQSRI